MLKSKNSLITEQSICPVCSSSSCSSIAEFSEYPITELFTKPGVEENSFSITKVDQEFKLCNNCGHGFLKSIVNPAYLYNKNNYTTNTTQSGGALLSVKNFASFVRKSIETALIGIDIGGNSSSLLNLIGIRKGYVVDPHASVDGSTEVKIVNSFFEDVDPELFGDYPKIVVSSHTLEHVSSPLRFIEFINSIAGATDIFIQVPCLELMYESSRYDLINNQHLHYFSLKSLAFLANIVGMSIIDYEYDVDHFGTLRVHLKPLNQIINSEIPDHNAGKEDKLLASISSFSESCRQVNSALDNLTNMYAYGASLLLPIAFWHLPSLRTCISILDSNPEKTLLKYVDIDIPIIHDNNIQLEDKSVCVTALGSRLAHRKILSNLCSRNPKYIISPFSTI